MPDNLPQDEISLMDARNADGSQRFYPPGKHPATARLQEHLGVLHVFDRWFGGMSDDVTAAIDYTEQRLAEFEYCENRAKREWLRARCAA